MSLLRLLSFSPVVKMGGDEVETNVGREYERNVKRGMMKMRMGKVMGTRQSGGLTGRVGFNGTSKLCRYVRERLGHDNKR